MEDLAQLYGATYVDYRSRLDDGLFFDEYHLRPEGGTALADLLAREVLAPLSSQNRSADKRFQRP